MVLEELRNDCAVKQKKGLHFILASILIWLLMLMIHVTPWPILTKNLFTFYATAPLMPLAFLISRLIKVDFKTKKTSRALGCSSAGQILPVDCHVGVSAVPEKMLMIMAMVFGAHLLPYSWLYKSKSYMVFAIAIPFLALLVGIYFEPYVLALVMVGVEILFSLCLAAENRAGT